MSIILFYRTNIGQIWSDIAEIDGMHSDVVLHEFIKSEQRRSVILNSPGSYGDVSYWHILLFAVSPHHSLLTRVSRPVTWCDRLYDLKAITEGYSPYK